MAATCTVCGGSGWNFAHTIMCRRCGGTGKERTDG